MWPACRCLILHPHVSHVMFGFSLSLSPLAPVPLYFLASWLRNLRPCQCCNQLPLPSKAHLVLLLISCTRWQDCPPSKFSGGRPCSSFLREVTQVSRLTRDCSSLTPMKDSHTVSSSKVSAALSPWLLGCLPVFTLINPIDLLHCHMMCTSHSSLVHPLPGHLILWADLGFNFCVSSWFQWKASTAPLCFLTTSWARYNQRQLGSWQHVQPHSLICLLSTGMFSSLLQESEKFSAV